MSSIHSHMDERDIAAELILERAVHKGSFLIVEGRTDVKRFRNFVSADCSITNAYSVNKAKGAMALLNKRGFPGALAVLDADFDRVRMVTPPSCNIIYSEHHDLDMDWLHTGALEKYLNEVADPKKLREAGGATNVLQQILVKLLPVSIARYLNAIRIFDFKVSGIDVGKFFCREGEIKGHYVSALIQYGFVDQSRSDWIHLEIDRHVSGDFDLAQLTNGHDVSCALGALLEEALGSRKLHQRYGSEVETHVRLAMDDYNFLGLRVVSSIISWEESSEFYVLSDRLRERLVKDPT